MMEIIASFFCYICNKLTIIIIVLLMYRWSSSNDQWWECKFISEGIIDQGGGFRDSLSDIAEEMCPSDPEAPMPLPFFIRAPNQASIWFSLNRSVFFLLFFCVERYHMYDF